MKKRIATKFLHLACILFAGCMQTRYSVIPQMSDVGNVPVATQYRWKLIGIRQPSSQYIYPSAVSDLENGFLHNYRLRIGDVRKCMLRDFPNVFAEDGIPFEIRIHDAVCESGMSAAWYLLTLGILPGTKYDDRRTTFSLEFGNECGIRSPFAIRTLHEEAVSCWTPFALWCNDKPYDAGRMRTFEYHDKSSFVFDGYGSERDELRSQALAYAVATRLKELEADSNKISAVLKVNQKKQPYRIIKCEREPGSGVVYSFAVELTDAAQGDLQLFHQIRLEVCTSIKANHLAAFPGLDSNAVFVDVMSYGQRAGKIEGRATVMQVSLVSLSYDADTHLGRLTVRLHDSQDRQAREWVNNVIATLAQDKNIALVTGRPPPVARYYVLRQTQKDGNLEIEFKTE